MNRIEIQVAKTVKTAKIGPNDCKRALNERITLYISTPGALN